MKTNRDYIRGLEAALRQVRRKLALKSARSINEYAEHAGMDASEVFSEACAEAAHEFDQRICKLILRESDKDRISAAAEAKHHPECGCLSCMNQA